MEPEKETPQFESQRWQTDEEKNIDATELYGEFYDLIDSIISGCLTDFARFLIMLNETDDDGRAVLIDVAMDRTYWRSKDFRKGIREFAKSVKAGDVKEEAM